MVKADYSRDYYGDLEISATADVVEIKKQFKKLALKYHPDRNPGAESTVTGKFQLIQSAHEVLIDAQERAKYDANRARFSSTPFRPSSAYNGGTTSGTRGNPWSNVSSQFPTPPKPPAARKPAPQSTGARRYEKFAAPNQSAYQAQQEGAEGRRDTYAAWENLRHQNAKEHGPGKTWKAPQPPPRGTPRSGREESNAQKHAPPPKARPVFEEFREANDAHGRSHSTNPSGRKGFMPNTPLGGDEPPAPMGAYFTQRNKSNTPPIPPPREHVSQREPVPNPLRDFRDKATPSMDARQSQPYATHGGEKFNLFESANNMERSKSTRARTEKDHVSRTGSDSNLASPRRAKATSFMQQPNPRQPKAAYATYAVPDDSSSEDLPQMKPSTSARRTNSAIPQESIRPTAMSSESTSKQSKFQQFRQWPKENPGQGLPLNGFPPDGPHLRSGQAKTNSNGEPSMYARPALSSVKPNQKQNSGYESQLPTVSEESTPTREPSLAKPNPYSSTPMSWFPFCGFPPVEPPSGMAGSNKLNAFEEGQRSLVNELINKRSVSARITPEVSSSNPSGSRDQTKLGNLDGRLGGSDILSSPTRLRPLGSSPLKRPPPISLQPGPSFASSNKSRMFWDGAGHPKTSANPSSSFSFNIDDDAFKKTGYRASFSNSTENIKFTAQDWEGKFEAGGDYLKPDQKTTGVPHPRAQSGSRMRGRSPPKARPTADTRFMQARVDSETPSESPSGAKFSPEEWAETFKPQTFMPPVHSGNPPRTIPGRKRTNPTIRPTMGSHAAMVDDSSTSDEKPVFNGQSKAPEAKRTSPPQTATPEPMDIDMTPPAYTVPQFMSSMAGKGLNINTEPLKRPAASSSTTSPIDEASLKVDLEGLKLQDLLPTLGMPTAPPPPSLPIFPVGQRPTLLAYNDYLKHYAAYMKDWDLYDSKFILHFCARKAMNETLGEKRWTEKSALEQYRKGLQEDQVVLTQWRSAQAAHQAVVKSALVLKEVMGGESASFSGEPRGDRPSPRKKAH